MKQFILTSLVIIILAGSADAQGRRGNNRGQQMKSINQQKKIQRLQTKGQLYNQLNMSSYQQSQADRINQNFASRLQSLRSNNRLTNQQKKSAIYSMVQQQQSGFRSILSPSQTQQYSSLLSNGTLNQFDLGNSGLSSVLGNYSWIADLLGSNLNLGSLLGGNLDLGSLLGLFTR